jgi:hypothetical protein
MTAIVPDTFQGALIVSVIDFFLSFLIISGIGVVLSLFPLFNKAAAFFEARTSAAPVPDNKPAPGAKAKTDADADAPDDIAAIAAAVFAVMDGTPHRIINIKPSSSRSAWVAEGRISHHSSHTPRT